MYSLSLSDSTPFQVIDRSLVQTWQVITFADLVLPGLNRDFLKLFKVDKNGELLEAKILKKLSHPAIVSIIEVKKGTSEMKY